MTINSYSIPDMINVLEKDYGCDGINYKTVWLWRMKLIHALASLPMPKLTGIVQVDETFIREAQKGSRELVSTINKADTRMPRYGRRPSKLGIMGPEFATIVSVIDNRGYCVCKVSSLGKLTNELFFDLIDEYLENPAYLCSDANSVYENYCNLKNIPHYERPSNYMTNVSTKYLQDYIGFFTYIRNWRVEHGHYPTSKKDTEEIFIEILKTKVNYTITDIKAQELELPKPTSRYIKLLEDETKKARKATSNKYFKFNEEDGVTSFNKREYLLDQPKSKLYAIAKECKITKYKQLALWFPKFLSSPTFPILSIS